MNYHEILSLSDFYLEDSYVLSIDEGEGSLTFELEAVLAKTHPLYKAPKDGEQYCYRKVFLQFLNADSIEWLARVFVKFADGAGDLDYGNIDGFVKCDDVCTLSGDWGRVMIRGGTIETVLID